MDFFQHQDRTRRNTKILVFLFVGAVIAIVAAVYLSAIGVINIIAENRPPQPYAAETPFTWWYPELLLGVTVLTLLIISSGTLYKIYFLRSGGATVATMLGGVPVNPATQNPDEKKLRNIVEEMSIASGIPVPQIFVLPDEGGINAFAAGFTPSDAAIGVTKGSIQLLTRDELQGVIAHEFSHILNGDMKLNIRLIGVLNGILLIGTTGYWVLRGLRGNKKGGAPIAMIGISLLIIGYVGVFFARMIQCAVSRQREFLADASAVQFTRNPLGLTDALKKIGGFQSGSVLNSHHSHEVSHMMFVNALKASWTGLFETHPPLPERIRTLDPSFKGQYTKIKVAPGVTTANPLAEGASLLTSTQPIRADQVMMQVGNPSAQHVSYAAAFLDALPGNLAVAARETLGAQATVYSILLDSGEEVRRKQLSYLQTNLEPSLNAQVLQLFPSIQNLGPKATIPLVDLALPALRQLSKDQHVLFSKNISELVKADQKVTLLEFVLLKILTRHLRPQGSKINRGAIKFRSLDPLFPDCSVLLSALAHAGHTDSAAVAKAYEAGMKRLTRQPLPLRTKDQCGMTPLNHALTNFALASPSLKQEILDAAVATVGHDGQVTTEEAELLRAIGDTLDCPIPPLLAAA